MSKTFKAASKLFGLPSSERIRNGLAYACLFGVISTSALALGCGGGFYVSPPLVAVSPFPIVYYYNIYGSSVPVYDGYVGPAFIIVGYRNGRPIHQQVNQTIINQWIISQKTMIRQPMANPIPHPQPTGTGPQPTVAPGSRTPVGARPQLTISSRPAPHSQPAGKPQQNRPRQPRPQ